MTPQNIKCSKGQSSGCPRDPLGASLATTRPTDAHGAVKIRIGADLHLRTTAGVDPPMAQGKLGSKMLKKSVFGMS
jgi:hypothetical protein